MISSPPFFGPARGRLAPSPTGRLHLGNAFAFLAAWLSIRKQQGTLVLRMEDIDPDRSRAEYARGIPADLAWLGLDWDEGPDRGGPCAPYAQSGRLDRYAALLADFERRGLVYPCFCTRKELRMLASAPHIGDEGVPYPGLCRELQSGERQARVATGRQFAVRLNTDAAVRALAPAGAVAPDVGFDDLVRGPQRYGIADCGGDFALQRSDKVVAYQLAVTADDADMGITEVVRGDDLLLSTPRQLLLFGLMGRTAPRYAHVPLLLDSQGERPAKRHKSLELAALREHGVAPEAVVGLLGFFAGLLEQPRRIHPQELVDSFDVAALRGKQPVVPDDVETLLRAL